MARFSLYVLGNLGHLQRFRLRCRKISSRSEEFYRNPPHPQYRSHRFLRSTFCNQTQWNLLLYGTPSGPPHDHTYRVQYATSDKPLGPYTYGGCILETNADGTIHGPGHHSILQEGNGYYIVYHRHDNPHSNRGFHRQLSIDRMTFNADGTIQKIIPTHDGVGALAPSVVKSNNLAFGKSVRASSFYDDNFRPEYAVDDSNGTLRRPRGMGSSNGLK